MAQELIELGGWSREDLERLLRETSTLGSPGERISFLSGHFLGMPYRESTLIGDQQTAEVFVVDLRAVDCMTFVEYVEAMRRSSSFEGFLAELRNVRYRGGEVRYEVRNHFFTDWPEYSPSFIEDVTGDVGLDKVRQRGKFLNRKEEESLLLSGIPVVERTVSFIPSCDMDNPSVLAGLKTGDYGGIFSEALGLDVSHVGIILKSEDRLLFRHASSDDSLRKVVDEDLTAYLLGRPGLVVLRPKDSMPEPHLSAR